MLKVLIVSCSSGANPSQSRLHDEREPFFSVTNIAELQAVTVEDVIILVQKHRLSCETQLFADGVQLHGEESQLVRAEVVLSAAQESDLKNDIVGIFHSFP